MITKSKLFNLVGIEVKETITGMLSLCCTNFFCDFNLYLQVWYIEWGNSFKYFHLYFWLSKIIRIMLI
ncbi:hypothetical protein IX49_17100 [Cellulophaga lytica]|nr:hypothetical protein IX49_17100 [Cellulophaga lytica]